MAPASAWLAEGFEFDCYATYERFLARRRRSDSATGHERHGGLRRDHPGRRGPLALRLRRAEGRSKLARRDKTPEEFNEKDLAAVEEAGAKGKEHRPIKVLIETRGEGGFLVGAQNGKVHPSGGAYQIRKGGVGDIVTLSPAERAALGTRPDVR